MKITLWVMVDPSERVQGQPRYAARDVDWPAVPRVGESLAFDGGNREADIAAVQWDADGVPTVFTEKASLKTINVLLADNEGWISYG